MSKGLRSGGLGDEALRILIEHLDVVLWVANLDLTRLHLVSPAYERIFQRPVEPLYRSSRAWTAHVHPDDVEWVRREVVARASQGYELEYRAMLPDGSVRWVRDRAFPVRGADGAVHRIVGITEDVTERRRAERELRESRERFEALVRNSSEVIFVVGSDARISYVSDSVEGLFGYRQRDLVGTVGFDFVHPEDFEAAVGDLARAVAEPSVRISGAYRVRHADGSFRHVEVTLTNCLDDPAIGGVIVNLRDVTRRVEEAEERERLENRIRDIQRMESLVQLAGGIAHDFNNLLAVIMNYASAAEREIRHDLRAKEDLVKIRRAAESAAELTHRLLVFGSAEGVEAVPLNVAEQIEYLREVMERTAPDLEVVSEVSGDLPRIVGDPGAFEQMLLNLALNARDATPDGGRLTIRAEPATLGPEEMGSYPGLAPGRHVRLTIADTGTGMSPDVAARAFEPFFTTKPKGEGTGLGLAGVYGSVVRAGGHIGLATEPGSGTTVEILWPVSEASASVSELRPSIPLAGARILVVDDEEAVLDIVQRILSRYGCFVSQAHGVGEAFDRIGADPPDLVLTDVVMGDGSGLELARRVRAAWPQVRVICMSGFAGPGPVEPDIPMLEKPFSEASLVRLVKRELGL